ncbi:MAG: metallophosphoesterase [Candidatus Aerophobetes bacterium]|nr:metallophosphoesterase [Candidatus Aerophobetes bacterium]
MNLEELAKKAFLVGGEELQGLITSVKKNLREERAVQKMNNLKIEEGLIHLPPEGVAIVVGDLHGDLESLIFILKESGFIKRVKREKIFIVFLGDYGDRGERSIEVYYLVLTLKSVYRQNVILLRGNHEGPKDLGVSPHDLPYFFQERYGEKWERIYVSLRELFDFLSHTVIVKDKYLMLHGGLPENISSIHDIAYAYQNHPDKKDLEEILWSDPAETEGSYPSPRGAGRIFGKDITMKILDKLNVKALIRSHQPCDGVLVNHKERVLTLFSRKGPPYYNSCAAYLEIDLSSEAKSARQLAKEAHKF